MDRLLVYCGNGVRILCIECGTTVEIVWGEWYLRGCLKVLGSVGRVWI